MTSVIDAPKQIFLQRAGPAVETLSRQAQKVEAEANSLVLFFGESPQETKPESVFDTIAQFLADLRVCSLPSFPLCVADHDPRHTASRRGDAGDRGSRSSSEEQSSRGRRRGDQRSPLEQRSAAYGCKE